MKNSKVLALKYRPSKLQELIGQEVIASTIYNSIKLNKIPNAFLLHGIRGVGKTSIARIIAKSLNCKNGIENLCENNFCENCEGITNSNHLDVIEQDCATATGIDSVRDLIEFCRYPPTSSNYKVLILDEIQAMSKAGAQSLLKILEEPPVYVKFIFCTTEIKKILVTMLSRCSRFDLSRIKYQELFEYLKNISKKENGNIDDEAIKLICKCSEGSVRDALSLLDRALLSSSPDNKLDLKSAQEIFGHFDKSLLLKLIEQISKGNVRESIRIYKLIYEKGVEPKVFLNEFLEILYYLKNISYIELEGTNFNLNDNEHKLIKELNENLSFSTILIYWQFTINTLSELNIVSNQHLTVEMFILRLIYLSNNEHMISNSKDKSYFSKGETSEVVEKKTNYNVINQLKNIDQKQENKPEVQTEENHNSIKSFQDLIELCALKKEFNLKYDLESNVRLVSFDKNLIEISFNENLDKNFIKILSAKLFEWTSERWIITLSKKEGQVTIKELKKKFKENITNDFAKSQEFKKIKQIFEDIKIKDLK